ncbi:MAG: hypothetical protein ACLFUJ_15175 [Phycisphaerae bacterium]
MNEAVVKERLLELSDTLTGNPIADSGGSSKEGVYLPHRVGAQPSVEDALDHLRMQLKYLMFDLEATRRENRYLRQMLEGRSRPDTTDGKG